MKIAKKLNSSTHADQQFTQTPILHWSSDRGKLLIYGILGGFNRIIFTSVTNNYILSFSSFLNKVKVKMTGI